MEYEKDWKHTADMTREEFEELLVKLNPIPVYHLPPKEDEEDEMD